MTDRTTFYVLGGGALALALLAASGRRPIDQASDEAEAEETAAAGFNPGNFITKTPEMGRLYETERGAIMLGVGDKSVTYRALVDAAGLAGIEDPERFAADSARRVAYASLILASPANAGYLSRELRHNDFKGFDGRGIDLRTRPVLWLPILDLDLLAQGIVQVARYEEDGEPCTELPPEIRSGLAEVIA